MMKFRKTSKFILIILGLFMFFGYIWLRFIRERFPKNIPINLSILGFLILVYICYIYTYIVYSYMRKNYSPKPLIIYIINFIYKPLIAFDNFLKTLPGVEVKYLKFMVYLTYKIKYIIQDTFIFYFIFGIFPRLVLVTALFIDTFWFHQLFYIYKVLLIGILLFLRRYIIYCFKHTKELLILRQDLYINSISTSYIHNVFVEYHWYLYDPTHEDYVEDFYLDIPPTMSIPLRKFIEIQTDAIVYENKKYDFMITNSDQAWEEIRIKYNLKSTNDITLLMNRKDKAEKKLNFDNIDNIVQISLIIQYYYLCNNSNETYNNLYKLIFTNYLLCWLYVLIISSNTLSTDSYVYILDKTLIILLIFILSVNHLYTYYLYKINKITTNDIPKS